jgi:diguanylate cyclase (GGDEF)-like protein
MLQQATAGVERGGAEFAVVFIDIDQFKFINDSLGHAAGDELLLVMTQRLLSCVRAGDMVARQGGDEFVIVLAAPVSAAEAQRIGGRILASVAQPCAIAGRDISVSCSIGVTLCPTDSRAVGDLLRNADAAMYRAKELGRNNVQFFAADMNQRLTDRLALLTHLHRAVERGEFGLVYEPKYDLATLEIIGVEALIRWHTPEGTISPVDFIPLAEETGLILPIGEWVLRAACEQNRRWRDAGLPPVPVAVNLSRRQLAHGDIATQVAVLLDAIGLPPDGLELEVTESMVMQDAEKSVAMLRRLHAMGVQIAMDDFGTGYSNLSNLKRFPLHCLKIDKSFVQDVGADPDAAAITKAIISLAHILGLRTVAEGVETVEQLEFLRENRCDETQGYYFTRPVTAEAFARLLQQQGFRPALTGS